MSRSGGWRGLAMVLVSITAAACGTTVGTPSAPTRPVTSPGPAALSSAGQPYSATDVLAKMATDRPPIPDAVQKLDTAAALSRAIWTYDGLPYALWGMDASCGPRSCEIYVGGAPSFLPPDTREDSWFFVVDLGTRRLTSAASNGRHELQGYPEELDPELDALARTLVDPSKLDGLVYLGAIWWPPPRFGEFTLRCGTGLEEGSRTVSVTLNFPQRRLIAVEESVT
jgi:hypothetical protein